MTAAATIDIDRATYERDGYLHLPGYVGAAWLEELQAVAAAFVEQSRHVERSDATFDVEPGHCADAPRLRRLNSPVDQHDTFARFALDGPASDLAIAVLGGPVRYHHSKLNFKWSDGGEPVDWHQDIQFWPHTDFSPLTIGVYLDDVDAEMGPMGVIPGSHHGPLYNLYGEDGSWNGSMRAGDIAALDLGEVAWLDGPAGSVTVHNCCIVHGSMSNRSARPRPLLLQTYSRADAYPILGIGANGVTGRLSGTVIGGTANSSITVDGRVIPGAPDWSRRGAPTIFGSQHAARG
jgi:hypothetical protein